MSRIVQECTRLRKKVKRSFERSKLRCLAWSSCAIEARAVLRRFREAGHTRNRWNLTPVYAEIACEIQGK